MEDKQMMDLAKFVSETLENIARGVAKARADCADVVAITVTDTGEQASTQGGSGGAELKVLGLGVSFGSDAKAEQKFAMEEAKVSRITFSVPIYFSMPVPEPDAQDKAVANAFSSIATLNRF